MKKGILLIMLFASLLFLGCSSGPNLIHERGWMGGRYETTPKNWISVIKKQTKSEVKLPEKQTKAVLVTHVFENTPAYQSGLREGDIILSANGSPVNDVDQLNDIIEQSTPGTTVALAGYHFGEMREYTMTVGREKYMKYGWIGIGIPISSRCDLWPYPDFNIFGLIRCRFYNDKMELNEPGNKVYQHLNQLSGRDEENNEFRYDVFKVNLILFHFGKYIKIISQEPVINKQK
ncbi:MAG: PDZ domain-containing protein [Planctomycetota bacterium]